MGTPAASGGPMAPTDADGDLDEAQIFGLDEPSPRERKPPERPPGRPRSLAGSKRSSGASSLATSDGEGEPAERKQQRASLDQVPPLRGSLAGPGSARAPAFGPGEDDRTLLSNLGAAADPSALIPIPGGSSQKRQRALTAPSVLGTSAPINIPAGVAVRGRDGEEGGQKENAFKDLAPHTFMPPHLLGAMDTSALLGTTPATESDILKRRNIVLKGTGFL